MSEPADWSADEALEELYGLHWHRMVRVASLLLGDVATSEEVVQDAFIALHRKWHRLRDPHRAAGYLRQAVVNKARSELRHRGVVRRQAAKERLPEPLPGADEATLADDRRTTVLAALEQLPTRQREVLVLRYYLDLSEADIATTLGISRGAVKSHASRGGAALREILNGTDL